MAKDWLEEILPSGDQGEGKKELEKAEEYGMPKVDRSGKLIPRKKKPKKKE